MLRWWKKNDGFEWREYVRTTILVRRNKRREKVVEVKNAAVSGLKQAGKASAEASASGLVQAWHGLRQITRRFASLSIQALSALGSLPRNIGFRLAPALAPAGRVIAGSSLHGPVLLIGSIGTIAALARWATSGLDTEAMTAGGLGLAGLAVGLLPLATGHVPPPAWGAAFFEWISRLPRPGPVLGGIAVLVGLIGIGGFTIPRYLPTGSAGSFLSNLPLAASKPIEGRATAMSGDIMKVSNVIVRLAGVESPEGDQRCVSASKKTGRCGEAAIEALGRIVRGKLISCTLSGSDEAGRSLATCSTEGNDIAATLVRQGHVFAVQGVFARYTTQEGEARAAKNGLWRSDIKRPAEWRAKSWEEAKRTAPAGCPIKGAVSNDGKFYVLPWSQEYDRVKVRAGRGERWFCSEQDARAAGWRLSEKS